MTKSDPERFDQHLAGQIFGPGEMQENLEILCDDMGSRFAGTAEEAEAARFLEAKLQTYGLTGVHSEPFNYNGWERGVARLTVTEPWQRDLFCWSLPMSPPGRVQGRVVDLGEGSPATIEASQDQLAGNIALVSIENPPDAERWIHRTEKYNRSILAGANAFLFMGNEDGYGPITGTLGFNEWGLIPGIMVSKETGLLLRRVIRRHGAVTVTVETTDRLVRKTSWNIIGDVPGTTADESMVVIGCHYDGHDISQGAEDPISGLVATLEVARVLQLHSELLRRRVRFVLFGVEELGLIGAHAYVNQHPDDAANTRFMFNLDASGGLVRKGFILHSPGTVDYFRSLDRAPELLVNREVCPLREPDHLSTDHYPFMLKGIPSGLIGDPYLRSWTGFYHTAHDTVDKVSLDNVQKAAYLCARLAWRIANEDDWPVVRPSADQLARERAVYDELEVRRIERAVAERRRQNAPD